MFVSQSYIFHLQLHLHLCPTLSDNSTSNPRFQFLISSTYPFPITPKTHLTSPHLTSRPRSEGSRISNPPDRVALSRYLGSSASASLLSRPQWDLLFLPLLPWLWVSDLVAEMWGGGSCAQGLVRRGRCRVLVRSCCGCLGCRWFTRGEKV